MKKTLLALIAPFFTAACGREFSSYTECMAKLGGDDSYRRRYCREDERKETILDQFEGTLPPNDDIAQGILFIGWWVTFWLVLLGVITGLGYLLLAFGAAKDRDWGQVVEDLFKGLGLLFVMLYVGLEVLI